MKILRFFILSISSFLQSTSFHKKSSAEELNTDSKPPTIFSSGALMMLFITLLLMRQAHELENIKL